MLSHIIRASLAGAAALGIASCAFGGAVSASYLGMGTSTGTPSGDVLAIINPHQRDRSPIISRDGGRVPDDGLERPEAVGQLNFQRPMRIAVHNEPGSEPDAEMINATKEFIRVMFGSQNVNIYYLNDRDLSQSIRTGGVDFFIADQSFYALEQAMGGVEQIAVMWPGTGDSPSEAMASTFFRKKPADGIRILDDRFTEAQLRDVELMILQAARVRFSHTEYIACPSCGRTLYDIEGTLAQIKARTSHLKNLKIGVMGCIVNGPGEMADADYGYVGAAPGRITLYKGRTVVERNIPQEEALDRLIALIRENGDWQEPE